MFEVFTFGSFIKIFMMVIWLDAQHWLFPDLKWYNGIPAMNYNFLPCSIFTRFCSVWSLSHTSALWACSCESWLCLPAAVTPTRWHIRSLQDSELVYCVEFWRRNIHRYLLPLSLRVCFLLTLRLLNFISNHCIFFISGIKFWTYGVCFNFTATCRQR